MADDWYVEAIDRIERSAAHLSEAIEATMESLRHARADRLAGVELVEVVHGLVDRGGRQARLAPQVAFEAFERAVGDYRSEVIRALVDEKHMTFSEVGGLTGVSRQIVAKLYRRAKDENLGLRGEHPAPDV
ncbi:MAG: hypothetical protein QOE35_1464 [Actinomycetota bacterium]|jgi:hypothetical protein